jgi:pyrimidine operon attenuation protein/uracil phosphoribosyltransferase
MSRMIHVMDGEAVSRALARIAHQMMEQGVIAEKALLVGLPTRGFSIARRLTGHLEQIGGIEVPVGKLDITFHRDDLGWRTPVPQVTEIPVDINGRTVILVDDVLFTGRTVRAALNALTDFGRPEAIRLVALVDRGHRRLPIKADFVGKNLPTQLEDTVHVRMAEVDGEDRVELETPS